MCICLWPEFDCPEVALCGWQDSQIHLLTNFLSGVCWGLAVLDSKRTAGSWDYLSTGSCLPLIGLWDNKTVCVVIRVLCVSETADGAVLFLPFCSHGGEETFHCRWWQHGPHWGPSQPRHSCQPGFGPLLTPTSSSQQGDRNRESCIVSKLM